ncbi:MAG: hypothetical protein ABEN55_01160, partial [Bradymonadaceae bacterium]
YGAAYREADDEVWRCDEADNDCDGEVDEACCGSGATPTPTQFGEPEHPAHFPAIVRAHAESPEGTAFLMGFEVDGEVVVQHLDRSGTPVGELRPTGIRGGDLRGVAMVKTDGGYAIAAAIERETPEFVVARLEPDLRRKTEPTTVVDSTSGAPIVGAGAAADRATIWVAYSSGPDADHLEVRVASLSFESGDVTTEPERAGASEDDMLEIPTKPSVAIVGGSPLVVWWDRDDERIRGGRPLSDRQFRVPAAAGSEDFEPVSVTGIGETAHLIYPDNDDASTGSLTHLAVGPDETGELSGATSLTQATALNRSPEAVAVDRDGDGTDDHLLMVWQRGSGSDATVVAGTVASTSPGTVSPRALVSGDDSTVFPALAVDGGRAGAVWQTALSGSAEAVEYAPVSVEGVPVCP